MKLNILRICFFVTLLLLSNSSSAQELGLDSFVQSILEHNPGVQRILSEKDIAVGELQASRGVDDAILSSSMSLSHVEPNTLLGVEATESDDARLNLSYDRLFSTSGTRMSLAYSNQYTDRNPSLSLLGSRYYQPSFTVRLTQPLLKNAGGIQDRLNIRLNELSAKLARLNSQENLESYISQLAALYIDWYLASQELDISKEVYQQVIEQESLTRTKVERQVIEPHELLRVQETREDYYSRLQQAKGRFAGLTHQIRHQMNLNNNIAVDELTPRNPEEAKLFAAKKSLPRKADYLGTTSNLRNILDSLKAQQLLLLNARSNSRKPDLNINFDYTRHGIDSNHSNAHTTDFDSNDYSVMLEYRFPLGNRQAVGKYQAQVATRQQIEADTRQRMIDAKANLGDLQAQASQLAIALESIDRKIELATKKISKELRLFKIGSLDLFELLRDQTTQLESRLNRERLYTQLLILQLNIGELLDQNLGTYSLVADRRVNANNVETVTYE